MFTRNQIADILNIVSDYQIKFIAQSLGSTMLTNDDYERLKKIGITKNNISKIGKIEEAFYFGMLSASLSDYQAKKVKYGEFKKWLLSGNVVPLNYSEQATINSIQNQFLGDIKGLNTKIEKDISQIINREGLSNREIYEKIIRKEAISAVQARSTARKMSLEIGNATGNWGKDFDRVSDYVLHTAFDGGRAADFKRKGGDDAEVWKSVYSGACSSCVKLYTTAGIGSEPIVFKLSELQANGNNIGRKKADWKPVVGGTHPYCFDDKTEVLTDKGWHLFKDVTHEQKILSVDLDTQNAEWVGISNFVSYYYSGKMQKLTTYNFDLLTTPDHHHVVNTRKTKDRWFLKPGKSLPNETRFLRTIPNWVGTDNTLNADFVEFLGYYLSEGSISKPKVGFWQLKIAQEKHYDKMLPCAKKIFNRIWAGKDAFYIPLQNEDLILYFRYLGKSYNKFVPKEIKNSSKEIIRVFLDAYCLGDGSRKKGKVWKGYQFGDSITYSTSSKRMADDLGELILKMGNVPSYRYYAPYSRETQHKNGLYKSKHPVYVISENIRSVSTYKNMPKECVDYNGMVYDVELEKNHTLFVRRNGKVTLSGNCRCTLNHKKKHYIWSNELKTFVPDPNYKSTLENRPKVDITVGDQKFSV